MPMVALYTEFPDLAFKEMRSITVYGRNDLPDGQYGFLESYCDEPGCDCRRVIINVISTNAGDKILATINYGWESAKFYSKWMGDKEDAKELQGPILDSLNPQTNFAPALLDLFKLALKDQNYVARLARHYRMFKQAIKEKYGSRSKLKEEFGKKVGRNDPCPCGSGKKYKKCCGAK